MKILNSIRWAALLPLLLVSLLADSTGAGTGALQVTPGHEPVSNTVPPDKRIQGLADQFIASPENGTLLSSKLVLGEALTSLSLPAAFQNICFGGPSGKQVTLHLDTGKVTYEGFTPDAAALQFWAAVTSALPYVRAILSEPRVQLSESAK